MVNTKIKPKKTCATSIAEALVDGVASKALSNQAHDLWAACHATKHSVQRHVTFQMTRLMVQMMIMVLPLVAVEVPYFS